MPFGFVSKTYIILLSVLKDRIALDLPFYDGLLAGHYQKTPGYSSKRNEGTDDWLLIASLQGQGVFNGLKGEVKAPPGTLTLISPGTPHDYGIAKGEALWELIWVHFHPDPTWLDSLKWPSILPGVSQIEPPHDKLSEILDAFWLTLKTSTSTREARLPLAMNALERLLLLCEEQLPKTDDHIDPRIRKSIEYIHSNLAEPLTLEILSQRTFLSPSRYSHLFREQLGMAPLQYATLQRMRHAGTLLERTTLSVAEIAAQVGMDAFQFSARFKSETGVGPRAFRTNQRSERELSKNYPSSR